MADADFQGGSSCLGFSHTRRQIGRSCSWPSMTISQYYAACMRCFPLCGPTTGCSNSGWIGVALETVPMYKKVQGRVFSRSEDDGGNLECGCHFSYSFSCKTTSG